jgi:hypothetical protein
MAGVVGALALLRALRNARARHASALVLAGAALAWLVKSWLAPSANVRSDCKPCARPTGSPRAAPKEPARILQS